MATQERPSQTPAQPPADAASDAAAHPPTGLAHVATVSFLASRVAPSGAFFIALAGGVALARTAARRGARQGYGASIAAMLQTVAIIGPARFNGPLTQAITAPMMGRLEARGVRPLYQGLACAAVRLVHNAVISIAVIWIVFGVDAFTGSYENLAGRLPFLPDGESAAIIFTAATLVLWTIFATTIQVIVYRRGLSRWPDQAAEEIEHSGTEPDAEPASSAPRFDPRAVMLAAAISFGLLLASTDWVVLAAVVGFLVLASIPARLDWDAFPAGLILAAVLAAFALFFSITAELGLDESLRRAARAALLVLTATWLRAAAGSAGLREVFRRLLLRLRRIPSLREAGLVLAGLDSGRKLVAAGRTLIDSLRGVPMMAEPIVDAVLVWVAEESGRFRGAPVAVPPRLRLRLIDGVLVVAAVLPAATLFAGA